MSSSSATTYLNRKDTILCLSVAIGIVSYISWRKYCDVRRRSRRRKQGSVNIGGIFGMDVGGTLTKIVYFEAKLANTPVPNRQQQTSVASSTAVPMDDLYLSNIDTATTQCLNDVESYESASKLVNNNYNQDMEKLVNTTSTSTSIKRNNSLHKLDEPDHQRALHQLYDDMKQIGNDARNAVDPITTRDEQLSFYSPLLEGRLHFLHFETRNMATAIQLLGTTAITENIRSIGCTGGGALKYARMFQDELGITFSQQDELASLVKGMHFALTNMEGECYTYRNRETVEDTTATAAKSTEDNVSEKGSSIVPVTSNGATTRSRTPTAASNTSQESHRTVSDPDQLQKSTHNNNQNKDLRWRKDLKDRTVKVFVSPFGVSSSLLSSRSSLPLLATANLDQTGSNSSFRNSGNSSSNGRMDSTSNNMPYLVVNVGSGVSILKVTSPTEFERVSGSSIGGGTYWGLSRLLTRCARYEEVLDIAEAGDASEVDMLVKDIYGGNYDHMNLSGAMVASSFGKLVMKDNPRDGIKEEDLAIALLMMITNNIGQVAYLNAKLHRCTKIFFVGSFLRHNAISCRRLAFAIDFWSKGEMEALFLTHEGYFGALGTFLQSAFGDDLDRVLSQGYGGGMSGSSGSGSNININDNIPTSRSTTEMMDDDEGISPSDKKSNTNSNSSHNNNYKNKNKNNNNNNRNNNNNNRKSSMYGIDSEFLNFLKDWQPLSFSALRGGGNGGSGNSNNHSTSTTVNEVMSPRDTAVGTKQAPQRVNYLQQPVSSSYTQQQLQEQAQQTAMKPDFRHAYSENNSNNINNNSNNNSRYNNNNNGNSNNNNNNSNINSNNNNNNSIYSPELETSYISLNNNSSSSSSFGNLSATKKSNSADAINTLANASLLYEEFNDTSCDQNKNNDNSSDGSNNSGYGLFPVNSRISMNINNSGGSVVSLDDLDIQRSSTVPLPSRRPSDQFLSLSLHDETKGRYDDDGHSDSARNNRSMDDTHIENNHFIDFMEKDYLQGVSEEEQEEAHQMKVKKVHQKI